MRHDGDGGRPRPKRSRKRGGPTSGAGHRRSKSHGAKNDLATGSLLAGRHAVLALLEHQPQRGVHLYMQKGARGLDAHRQAAMKAHIPISELDKEALTQRYGGEPNQQGVLLKAGAYVYLDEEEMLDGSPS